MVYWDQRVMRLYPLISGLDCFIIPNSTPAPTKLYLNTQVRPRDPEPNLPVMFFSLFVTKKIDL